MLAPVLACLLLATASCSKDATETEAVPSPGGTYLTIVTRGINTTDENEYEDYVGKLRVMAFDSEGKIVPNLNFTIDNMAQFTVEGIGDDAYIEVTKVFESGAITSGVYTFYFVANEDGYTTTTLEESLSNALGAVNTEDDLKNIQVAVEMSTEGTVKPSRASSMLMSTEAYTAIISEGEDNRIGDNNHIELIRAFAKAQLVIRSEENTINVSASLPANQIPSSYYLIPKESIENNVFLSGNAIPLNGNGTLFDGEVSSVDNKYVSQVVYLPERAAADEAGALKYSITIDGESYSAPIADGTEDSPVYTIERNYAYTTIGTYDPAKPATIDLTYTVQPFTEVESEHTFN